MREEDIKLMKPLDEQKVDDVLKSQGVEKLDNKHNPENVHVDIKDSRIDKNGHYAVVEKHEQTIPEDFGEKQGILEDKDETNVKKTKIYTDPNGVQYDVEYLGRPDQDAFNKVEVVGVTDQETSNVVYDSSEKLADKVQ